MRDRRFVYASIVSFIVAGLVGWFFRDINVFLSIVSLGVTIVFGFIADQVGVEATKLAEYANQLSERNQEFTEKFSPVDISNLKETSVKMEGDFVIEGFSINIIRNYISGHFKDIYVAWYSRTEGLSAEQLFMESLISEIDGSGRQLVLNLTNQWAMPDVYQRNHQEAGKAELLFFLGEKPVVNLLFIIVEDYQGMKQYIIYVLYQSVEGNQKLLCCYPLKQWSLFSKNEITKIYERIDFQNDPFWKGKKIRTITDFRQYLLRKLQSIKQEG